MTVVEEPKCFAAASRRAEGVALRIDDDDRVLVIVDDLDSRRVATFRAALAVALAESDDVKADLSSLRTLGPLGIRELLRAQALAAQLGKSFAVVEVSANVRRLLDVADAAGLLSEDAR